MKISTTPFSRRLVIPDIHGCFKTLKALVRKIGLTKNDALFFLGDYIDRGQESSKVIDYIINLQEAGYTVFPLMGNHEYDLLKVAKKMPAKQLFTLMGESFNSADLIDKNKGIKGKYKDFFNSLEFYYELEDFFIVHAGFNFEEDHPFSTPNSMLYIRNFTIDKQQVGDKKIIHGHQPVYLNKIREYLANQEQIIPLDNGCIYSQKHRIYDFTQLSNLLCLNLDTFELIIQPNIEAVKYGF